MDKAKVTFTRCVLSTQEYAREQNEARGTVYFTVEHEGKRIEDSADFRQGAGPRFERGAIELMTPQETTFLSQEDFAVKALEYIQNLLWAEGSSVGDSTQPGGISGTREGLRGHEHDNVFNRTVTVEVAVQEAVPMQPVEMG
jgi:hypothetical protein